MESCVGLTSHEADRQKERHRTAWRLKILCVVFVWLLLQVYFVLLLLFCCQYVAMVKTQANGVFVL